MKLFSKRKYYEAIFIANSLFDQLQIEKELVATIALDLAIGKSYRAKKIKVFEDNMTRLPEDYLGIDNLSYDENMKFVNQAKNLIADISKGIFVDTGFYSIRIKMTNSGLLYNNWIKIKANRKESTSEMEAEAHSMMLEEKLEYFSDIRLIENTFTGFWGVYPKDEVDNAKREFYLKKKKIYDERCKKQKS